MTVAVEPEARRLLEQPVIGNFGFQGLDGYPRVIPVWFDFTGEDVRIASPPGAYKSRALQRDPRAVLTVSTSELPYRVVSVTGDVRIDVMDESTRIEVVRANSRRYLGPEGGRRYLDAWVSDGSPGPGDLLVLVPRRIRYTKL